MALRDQPYLPLYVQDFLSDEKLNECSANAHGVYIKLMCLMHKSEQYGKILLEQKYKQSDKHIVNFANKLIKHLPFTFDEIVSGLTELESEKVIQISCDEISQKRMIKDNELSIIRAEAGSKGGKKTQFAKAKVEAKHKANTENEIGDVIVIDNYSSLIKEKVLDFFPEKFQPKTDNQIAEWVDCLRKLIEIDGYTENEIMDIIFWARQDKFWSTNFLTIHKLRKKNSEGLKYIDVFKHKKNCINGSQRKTNGNGVTDAELAGIIARKFATDKK